MEGLYVLIPARSGSKSIIDKNIRDYFGLPLMVHSILHAKRCKYVQWKNIYVSTDSEKYADIAREYGVGVVMRPKEISDDLSTDLEVFQHFLKEKREENIEWFVHLRPTYPNRREGLLDECVEKMMEKSREGYESLRTVIPVEMTPYKMYHMIGEELNPIFKRYGEYEEPYNMCRQMFPQTYLHNGCIDIVRREVVEGGSMTGKRIYGYRMDREEDCDIDTEDDMKRSKDSYRGRKEG